MSEYDALAQISPRRDTEYEHKYVIVRDMFDSSENPLKEIEKLLADGWEPLRECPMPSSVCGSYRCYAPTCMVVLRRVKGVNDDVEDPS